MEEQVDLGLHQSLQQNETGENKKIPQEQLETSIVITPTNSNCISEEVTDDEELTNESIDSMSDTYNNFKNGGNSKADMELLLTTYKENALDLALSEQVEQVQIFNAQLMELLQSEKERCDELLKRNDKLSQQISITKTSCIELSEQKRQLEMENTELKEKLESEKELTLKLSNRLRNEKDECRNSVSLSLQPTNLSNLPDRDKIGHRLNVDVCKLKKDIKENEVRNSGDQDSLDLSATGCENSYLLGQDFLAPKSNSKLGKHALRDDVGIIDATMNPNSFCGPSDFILDLMEGAGFDVPGGGNDQDQILSEESPNNDSQVSVGKEDTHSFIASPIPIMMSPGNDTSSISLDFSSDRKCFAGECATIRRKLSSQNSDVNTLLQEVAKFEHLYKSEQDKVDKIKREMKKTEEKLYQEREEYERLSRDSEVETCSLQEQISSITTSLAIEREGCMRLKQELSEAETKVVELADQLSTERERAQTRYNAASTNHDKHLKEMESEISKCKQTIKDKEKIFIELNETIELLKSEVDATKHEAKESVESQYKLSQTELSKVKLILTDFEKKCEKLETENEELRHSKNEIVNQCQNLEQDLDVKVKSICRLDRTTSELSVSVNDANSLIENLTKEKGHLNDLLKQSTNEKEVLKDNISQIQKDLNGALEAFNNREKDIRDSEKNASDLELRLNEATEQLHRVNKHVKRLNNDIDLISKEKDEIMNILHSRDKHNSSDLEKIEKLERKNLRLRECIEKLNKKCFDWQDTYTTLSEKFKKKIDERRSSMELKQENNHLKEKLRKMKESYKRNMTNVTKEMKLIQGQVNRFENKVHTRKPFAQFINSGNDNVPAQNENQSEKKYRSYRDKENQKDSLEAKNNSLSRPTKISFCEIDQTAKSSSLSDYV